MNDQIRQIAERLRGLRDVLELTAEDIARGRNRRLRHLRQYAAKDSPHL